MDSLDYDFDDVDNDPSDEDDWGSSKRKKKKGNPGQGSTGRPGRRSNAAITPANGGKPKPPPEDLNDPTIRPYACQRKFIYILTNN